MDAVTSAAGSFDPSSFYADIINFRKNLQNQRISQGTASGQLTQAEQAKLGKDQSRVDSLEQQAESDGSISSAEFARIMHAQNKASRHIHHMRHNGATAEGGDADALGVTASNAQLSFSASNASATGSAVWADMNKLMQDIAQLRQDRQAERIQEGTQSGQLTQEEARKLSAMETDNATLISNAMADGGITPQEFQGIMQAQNAASRQIRHYRHNHQSAQAPAGYTPVNATA